MTQLRITAMDHIVLNVSDIDRSLAFYINVLGLKGERVDQFRRGEVGFPSVRISDTTLIDLMKVETPPLTEGASRNLNHYCMVAESLDLTALVEMLHLNDVPVLRG